jgi:hypothetical protein
MFCGESAKVLFIDRLADPVCNVDREKIAWREEAIDGVQIDVIRIAEVRLCPAAVADRRIGCGPRFGGL